MPRGTDAVSPPRPLIPPPPPPNRHTNPPAPKTASRLPDRDHVRVDLLLLRLPPLLGYHPPVRRGQLPTRLLRSLLHHPGIPGSRSGAAWHVVVVVVVVVVVEEVLDDFSSNNNHSNNHINTMT